LYNIKARHVLAKPYTRTGDIVIAVNPYQWLTHLYTPEEQKKYANKLVWEAADQDNRKQVEPHIYETSAMCYKGLALDQMNQSILVSGESGAGKTETVKICMNHMAAVQRGTGCDSAGENPVVQRVVDSNPLLEAFGNAKTRRNDNSSRFGKYIQLQFEREEKVGAGVPRCILAGSKCEVYLLEKSRITEHEDIERTYHIFYQLIGCKEADKMKIWPGLKGTKNESFKYVGHTDTTKYEGKEDGDHYYSTCEGLAKVGINEENGKVTMLFRAIAIVLQLGQLNFGARNGDAEASACTTPKEIDALADLMGIPVKELEPAICERTMITRGETFKVPLKAELAKDNADAYAKEIYSKVFLWLVREVNAATCAEENYDGNRNQTFTTIGLLDIFGFESFPVNGFEQLCINYANEKLQQKFTRDIFATVQDEYKFEGIALDDIKYDDNSDVLDLIEGRTGLLAILNEECVRPKGSDKEFVYKAKEGNKKSACLIADRLLGPLDFGIHHYAGKVVYFAQGFLARNMDTLGDDLKNVSTQCNNEIIAKHLTNEKMMWNETESPAAASARGGVKRGKSNIAADTLWTKFRTQLNSLMKNLNTTQSRYIRCVKPNTVKKPLVMFHMTTIEQLRCAGVVAAVTISRSAFPNRLDHRACYERFKVLIKQKGEKSPKSEDKVDFKECIMKMCDRVLANFEGDGKKAFVIGKTRIYFRLGAMEFLEGERQKGWDVWALDVQRSLRGFMVRRTNTSRKMLAKGPQATKLACWWRVILAKRELKKLKKAKKFGAKKKKKQLKAAIKIQAVVRTFLWRPKFLEMVKDSREKSSLRNNLKELEKKLAEAEAARQKEVEEARLKAETEMEEHRKKMKLELSNDKEKQKKFAQQQSLIEESGKIIEYLRKENMKLRTQNDTMRKDFKALKENNQRLMEANASASSSFNALNDHAKQLNATNAKLIKNVESYKLQLEKLKDDLKTRQSYYLAEAEARLTYQKTMAQIVGSVQDKCRDAQLVEDVVIMALECEAEAKAERASLEAAAKKAASAKTGKSSESATPSVTKTETSAESDSDSDED
jgi:myosin V